VIVVDSNVIAHRHLSSGQTTLAERVERKDSLWIMPRLWRYLDTCLADPRLDRLADWFAANVPREMRR
jgi:aminoglycoside/choline kinase family phosphotransferase